MALLQSTLIWIVYAIVVALLIGVATVFIYAYQGRRDRSAFVTTVCIFTLTALLATVLLLPVDVALVSSTTSSKLGRRKDWATQDEVDKITYSLTIVYYFLYTLDAVLCLLVVPFAYFWYEEYDEVAQAEGSQGWGSRFLGATKYTIVFVILAVVLFLVGFFVPVAKNRDGPQFDFDYFRKLLTENRTLYRMFLLGLKAEWLTIINRWRTRADLCAGTVDHSWDIRLRFLYSSRACSIPSVFYQIIPVYFQSSL